MSDILVENFLAHYGVPGMHWGQRKTSQEISDGDRKKSKLNGSILGGTIGALGAITLVELMAKNGPAPIKKKGLAYVLSLFKKKPPTVVLNPKNLNTANLAARALTGSRYGKAVIALGGFTVTAAIGSKIAGANFDKDQLNPTRLAAREANTDTAQSVVKLMKDTTSNYIEKPTKK